jgi:hypothetical protein
MDESVGPVFNSSEKRLARTLLLLANFGKERRPEPITTKISQETLAEIIGSINSAGSASNRLRPPLSGSSQYQASRLVRVVASQECRRQNRRRVNNRAGHYREKAERGANRYSRSRGRTSGQERVGDRAGDDSSHTPEGLKQAIEGRIQALATSTGCSSNRAGREPSFTVWPRRSLRPSPKAGRRACRLTAQVSCWNRTPPRQLRSPCTS